MTDKEIIEGNKKIAEFMGATFKDISRVNYPKGYKEWEAKFPKGREFNHYGTIGDLISKYTKYHSSWDWLMPVVAKIESLESKERWMIEIVAGDCYLYTNNSGEYFKHIGNNKIESVYSVVVQFITWYNSQSNNNQQ